jgi:hypothetical protein
VHRRQSGEKLQRRLARRMIFRSALRDTRRGEVVCRVSRVEVLAALGNSPIDLSLVPDVEKGEVLADSRGRGTFQK